MRAPLAAVLALGAVIVFSGTLGMSARADTDPADPPTTDTSTVATAPGDETTIATTDPSQTGVAQGPAPASDAPAPESYVIALWKASYDFAPKFPQTLVASSTTTSSDIHQLDGRMTACGTSYQADLYADDAKTAALISSAVLHDNDESFPGGGWAPEYSESVTTSECAAPPTDEPTLGSSATPSPEPSSTTGAVTVTAPSAPLVRALQLATHADASWTFTVQGVDLSDVHPGDQFTVTGAGLAPGAVIIGELHSKAVGLGTVVADASGSFSMGVSVPSDFPLGAHELVMSLTEPGGVSTTSSQAMTVTGRAAAAPAPVAPAAAPPAAPAVAGSGHNALPDQANPDNILTHGLASIADVVTHPQKIPAALAIGLVLLLFAVLPAHLLNATIAEQYERFARRIPRLRRRPRSLDRLMAFLNRAPFAAGLALTSLTALLFGLADPRFGFTVPSLRLILGLAIAMAVVVYGVNAATSAIMRRRWAVDVTVSLRPLGLILTIAGVIVSRALDFSPGFLIGLALGLAISEKSASKFAWRAILIRSGLVLALAAAAWLCFSIFSAGESEQDVANFGNELFLETLVAVVTEGTVALLIELLPFKLLEGERLYRRSRPLWAATYLVALVIFIVAVVPWEGNWETLGGALWVWIAIVVGFGVLATSTYLVFRFLVPPVRETETAPGDLVAVAED